MNPTDRLFPKKIIDRIEKTDALFRKATIPIQEKIYNSKMNLNLEKSASVASMVVEKHPLPIINLHTDNLVRLKKSINQDIGNFPVSNIVKQIYTKIPTPNISQILKANKIYIDHLSKYDFRISVLEQKVTDGILELLENSAKTIDIADNDKANDFTDDLVNFDEKLLKSTIYAKDKRQQAKDITYIKDFLWKNYETQRDQINQIFKETVQKKEQSSNSKNSFQLKILPFIDGVLRIITVITLPKVLYDFLVWISPIISLLLNK